MFKFKKILVSVVILAVFLGTMSIFASAAYETQVGRNQYSISTGSSTWNGKDNLTWYRFESEVSTEWNVSIITEQTRIINAQLKRIKEYATDPTIREIIGFEGANYEWETQTFVPDEDYSYYVIVKEPAKNGVTGYYSFYQ
ncbi:MAG: hypothetical protein IJ333_02015 [Clostridia bacterium]|nr:hypothetical protein [Clostridia bacterium]